MASESKNVDLSAIPSSVSGDGTTFVKGLKKYLKNYSNTVEDIVANSSSGLQVSNISLFVQHVVVDGVNKNNIYVTFDSGTIANYAFSQIWITENPKDEWTLDGVTNTATYMVEDVTAGNTYYVKVVGCNKYKYADFDSAPVALITINGASYTCNVPTQFYWDNSNKRWKWSGYIDNGYTNFFEIRTDKNAGTWDEHKLDTVSYSSGLNYSTVPPPSRSGTAYLFVQNIYGTYNSGIAHIYSIGNLNKPTTPVLSQIVDGVSIELQSLPEGAKNYVVNVDGEEFEVYTSQWVYHQFTGSITVKYCVADSVSRSEWSDSVTINVGREIGTDDIAVNAITATKIDSNAITTDKINSGAITADKIQANAIVIGGDTDNGKVVINDNGISASKLNVSSLSAICANLGTVTSGEISCDQGVTIGAGSVTINSNGIYVQCEDGGTVALTSKGIWCKSKYGNLMYWLTASYWQFTGGATKGEGDIPTPP